MAYNLANNFTYHPPDKEDTRFYQSLRGWAMWLAENIVAACPESRERSLALTKLEECVMWTNAARARYTREGEPKIKETIKKILKESNND